MIKLKEFSKGLKNNPLLAVIVNYFDFLKIIF